MSRWFSVRDRHHAVLFGVEQRCTMEVYDGCDPTEAANELHADILREHATEAEAEAAIKSWASAPTKRPAA